MAPRYAPSPFNFSRVVIIALSLGLVAGWGMYFAESRSAAEVEGELQRQLSSLHKIQMDLLSEKEQTKAAVGDLERLRNEVASLRQETDVLTQARDLARAELVTAATGMKELIGQLQQTGSDVSATGTVAGGEIDSQHIVTATAQKALTKLGYGPLKADGVVGIMTRQAIEQFQRSHKLPVTSELDAPTLSLLVPAKQAGR